MKESAANNLSKRNSLTGGPLNGRVSPSSSKLAKTVKLQPKNTRDELLVTVASSSKLQPRPLMQVQMGARPAPKAATNTAKLQLDLIAMNDTHQLISSRDRFGQCVTATIGDSQSPMFQNSLSVSKMLNTSMGMTSLHAARLERKLSKQRDESFSQSRQEMSQTLRSSHNGSQLIRTGIPQINLLSAVDDPNSSVSLHQQKQFSNFKSLRVQAKQIKLESSRDHSLSMERSGIIGSLADHHRQSLNNLMSCAATADDSFQNLLTRNNNDSCYMAKPAKTFQETRHSQSQTVLSPKRVQALPKPPKPQVKNEPKVQDLVSPRQRTRWSTSKPIELQIIAEVEPKTSRVSLVKSTTYGQSRNGSFSRQNTTSTQSLTSKGPLRAQNQQQKPQSKAIATPKSAGNKLAKPSRPTKNLTQKENKHGTATRILDLRQMTYAPEVTFEEVDGIISQSKLPIPESKPVVQTLRSPDKRHPEESRVKSKRLNEYLGENNYIINRAQVSQPQLGLDELLKATNGLVAQAKSPNLFNRPMSPIFTPTNASRQVFQKQKVERPGSGTLDCRNDQAPLLQRKTSQHTLLFKAAARKNDKKSEEGTQSNMSSPQALTDRPQAVPMTARDARPYFTDFIENSPPQPILIPKNLQEALQNIELSHRRQSASSKQSKGSQGKTHWTLRMAEKIKREFPDYVHNPQSQATSKRASIYTKEQVMTEKDDFKVYLNESYSVETPPRPEVLAQAAPTQQLPLHFAMMRQLEIEDKEEPQSYPRFNLDEGLNRVTNTSIDQEYMVSTQFFYDKQQGNNESALLLKTLQSMDQRGQNSLIEETFATQVPRPLPQASDRRAARHSQEIELLLHIK